MGDAIIAYRTGSGGDEHTAANHAPLGNRHSAFRILNSAFILHCPAAIGCHRR
jgi:hypothetical protein